MPRTGAKRKGPAVLHYMSRWLPLSEQFVYGLVKGSSHHAIVVSRNRPSNRKTFPYRPVISLNAIPSRSFPGLSERRILTAALLTVVNVARAGIIHVHHGYNVHDVEGVIPRSRVGFVVSFHGQDVIVMRRTYGADVFHSVLARADSVIVPSRFLAAHAIDAGADPEKIQVIPAGVNLRWFEPSPLPDGPPEVLFAGRFVEKKGLDVLMRAWPVVKERVPSARLRLLGYGTLEAVARSGGEDVVVEPTDPARRATQVRDAIRAARAVVTPSRTSSDGDSESLLLVNLEAQASGRPLVTTDHGGIPEFVADGETALLVPENDAEALADALARVLLDHELAERMAAAGPVLAARFDVRDCTARVDDLYESLEAR